MNRENLKRKLRPTMDRVLVRLKDVEAAKEVKTDWGFVTEIKKEDELDREKHATQEAYVVWLGPWSYGDNPVQCKEGDLVLITKWGAQDRKDIADDGIYRLVKDIDILAVFEGEEYREDK